MVTFLRTAAATTGAATAAVVAASAIPVALAFSSPSSNPHQNARNPKSQPLSFSFLSRSSPGRLGLVRNFTNSPMAAVRTDAPASDLKVSQENVSMPELLTEYMVDMKCEGCVSAVKSKLESVEGIKNVEVDLPNQVVRITGSSSLKTMTEALEQTGRKARLIGQGVPEDFLVSAAVAEFKGPNIFGVVRFAQVNMELARIEANFSGLSPGKHGWSINEFGDLTRGAASTGKIYNPLKDKTGTEPLGDLGTLEVNQNGEAYFTGTKLQMRVVDLIGRAVVVYGAEEKSEPGLTAAVIARSAGVGENYKKLCTCDGTTIWEATNKDFVTSKV